MPQSTRHVHTQDAVQEHALGNPEQFWAEQASKLTWHKKPSKAIEQFTRTLPSGQKYPSWAWFPDGEISTTYNCIDRHVEAGNGDKKALIWDSPVTNSKESYTYSELLTEVETLASVLQDQGLQKGDVVLIYMPMIPASIFGILATSRLGAIHAVVFGGFSAASLAQRMEASKPKIVLTASCGIEGNKKPLDYRQFVEEAIKLSSHKPETTLIWQREQHPWAPINESLGQKEWKPLIDAAKKKNHRAKSVPVKSNDSLYIIYTSGTTSTPKGVVREVGGHAVGLHASMAYLFGIRGPGDVMFCASDIGWVVGHCYIIYAPLLVGATTVLFEGKPIGTPDAGTFWRIVEEYKVNTLFTAPTALRAIRKEDPENKHFKKVGERDGLRSLNALFLAGERSEPAIVSMYGDLLSKYCADDAQVVDNWWSSESGSPMTGTAMIPSAFSPSNANTNERPLRIKPGSAGKPMPGHDIRIVDDSGEEVPPGTMGNVVLKMPLAPTALTTLFNDAPRFYKSYLSRFDSKWLDTGDAGFKDEDGYVSIMARADDIINVAAHRFSTGAIEQAVTSHANVTEACVIGIPDEYKGHLPFAFVTLASDGPVDEKVLFGEIQELIVKQIGKVARLGGMIVGKGMIPKTRSGKTLRRVLRELVEHAVKGEYEQEVSVPATVEDRNVVEVARGNIRSYFEGRKKETNIEAKL